MWGKFLHGPPRMLTRDLFAVADLLLINYLSRAQWMPRTEMYSNTNYNSAFSNQSIKSHLFVSVACIARLRNAYL